MSAIKSGAKPEDARSMAREVESKVSNGIQTQEIRTKMLAMLRQKNPALEKNWLVYDQAVKKRA